MPEPLLSEAERPVERPLQSARPLSRHRPESVRPEPAEGRRVVVAMSGGVDSSVAAGLLLEQGYDVVGVTMRLWSLDDPAAPRRHRRCCSVEDTDDARAAADALGIPHYVLNFERQFSEGVVDHFVAEYARGRTPNPCLACNNRVKFRPPLEHALALGADYLATGHYARSRRNGQIG